MLGFHQFIHDSSNKRVWSFNLAKYDIMIINKVPIIYKYGRAVLYYISL